jgi:hypothetical protein
VLVRQAGSAKLIAIAIVAGVATFAGVTASAATLGGIKTADVGANSNAVAPQLSGGLVATFATAYNSTVGYYTVNSVTLTRISGGESIPATAIVRVTLKGAAGTFGEYVQTGGTAVAITVPVAAADVTGISVVINGGAVTAALATVK